MNHELCLRDTHIVKLHNTYNFFSEQKKENVSNEISRDVNGNGIIDRNDKPNLGDNHMGDAGIVIVIMDN
jgi:hypothetical protein